MSQRGRFGCLWMGLLFALGAACGKKAAAPVAAQAALIFDEVHNGGPKGFFWLPPLVAQPHATGNIRGDLSPVVRIDEIDKISSAFVRTVATFTTTTGPGSETVRIGNGGHHYIVNWHTGTFDIGPAFRYRITVLLNGRSLGLLDVEVVAGGNQLKNVDSDAFIGLVDGKTLPIKFLLNACAPVVCGALDSCHSVGVCNADNGACTTPVKADGTACSDGNACTQTDACSAGVCAGGNPVVCAALDQCHHVGTCDSVSGVCSNPNRVDGTTCSDGNACTQTDACSAGVCAGGNPVVCAGADQCHDPGICNNATGACTTPAKADGTACSDSNACTQTDACSAGVCAGGNPVVCAGADQCHDAGICNNATGVCTTPAKADGTACSDGSACTQTDACSAGVCAGTNPVTCTALDQCHDAGICNNATGACTTPAKADGTACSDGNACTQTDACSAGLCAGGNPVTCTALDQCHDAGICNNATGACTTPAKADGTACSDGNACTQTDACSAGLCAGGNPVTCTALDQCHDAGICNNATGACTTPAKADGTACSDGNACTQTDVCSAGVCAGGNPVVCSTPAGCSVAAACVPSTGICTAAGGCSRVCGDGVVAPAGRPPATVDFVWLATSCEGPQDLQFTIDGVIVAQTQIDGCTCDSGIRSITVPFSAALPSPQLGSHVFGAAGSGSYYSWVVAVVHDGDYQQDVVIFDAVEGGASTRNPYLCSGFGSLPLTPTMGTVSAEECDDGNTASGDGCSASCQIESCGNGRREGNEECDDGNTSEGDGCSATCVVEKCFNVNCPLGTCQGSSTCDPATGQCVSLSAADGTACNDGELCTTAKSCVGGACVGGVAVICAPPNSCWENGRCLPQQGCVFDLKPIGAACGAVGPLGSCVGGGGCYYGSCIPSSLPDGVACDDGDGCTVGDACQSGGCAGTPRTCPASPCHEAGSCNVSTGQCVNPVIADGTTCDDGNVCTGDGACSSGVCQAPPNANGTACDDGDSCRAGDTCQSGTCTPVAGCQGVCGDGVVAPPRTPTSIEFVWLATCSGGQNIQFTIDGVVAAQGPADDGFCSCSARIRSITVTDVAVRSLLARGNHAFGIATAGLVAWAVAVVHEGTHEKEVVIFDAYGGGDAEARHEDLCGIGYGSAPVVPTLGFISFGEECDDGNTVSGDGCSATCGLDCPGACVAIDQCHGVGICDYQTGACTNPVSPDGTACSDANACTQVDSCQAGACTGANPVVCAGADPCREADTCEPDTGTCTKHPKADGLACSDGNACTQVDVCQLGNCVGANPVVCNTPSGCSIPSTCRPESGICSSAGGCQSICGDGVLAPSPIPTSIEFLWLATSYGDPLDILFSVDGTDVARVPADTGSSRCFPGIRSTTVTSDVVLQNLQSGRHAFGVATWARLAWAVAIVRSGDKSQEVVIFDAYGGGDAAARNPDLCAAVYSTPPMTPTLAFVSLGEECDDGNTANGDGCSTICQIEGCGNGRVEGGEACDDGNTGNGDGCTATCRVEKCFGVVCEGFSCTESVCDPESGQCSYRTSADGTTCDDFNACTLGDTCTSGSCNPGLPVTCAAPDACHQAGICEQTTGQCVFDSKPDGVACDDGNPCKVNGVCASGLCQAEIRPDGVACDDGNPCKMNRSCSAGLCQGDSKPDGVACEDGNACSIGDICTAGSCQAGVPKVCPASTCHDAGVCDTGTGHCVNPTSPDGSSCDNGDLCPIGDTCQAGSCMAAAAMGFTPGQPLPDDGNPCTVYSCDLATGASHVPVASGTSCSDGNSCNGIEICNAVGGCQVAVPPAVDDGNLCTADTCDPVLGVRHVPVAVGTSCDDGDVCNGVASCSFAGACRPGALPILDDGNSCTADTCHPLTGVAHSAPPPGATGCEFPDLTVESLTAAGTTVNPATLQITGSVSAVVKDRGTGAVPQGFALVLFEDKNRNRRFDPVDDTQLGRANVGSMAAFETRAVTVTVDGPVSFPGNLLSAYVDIDGEISESDESNNYNDTTPPCVDSGVHSFLPAVKWSWTASATAPSSRHVMMTPAVADINRDGRPDVVFVTFGAGDGRLRVLDGRKGQEIFTASEPVFQYSAVAVGDIDNDGLPEIITSSVSQDRLLAFGNDGALKWRSDVIPGPTELGYGTVGYSSPSLADLDGDGRPEIIVGSSVVDNTGRLRWTGTLGQSLQEGGRVSLVADLDMDGVPEVVAGRTAYRADGTVFWNANATDGYVAVGNFDGDAFPEVVLVGLGTVYMLEHDGTITWSVPLPGGGYGGAPTVADMDGDGAPDIGIAGASKYVVFRSNGSVMWTSTIVDYSSHITGSTVFDFDGDGTAEVVYGDEQNMRIFRGRDGAVLWKTRSSSATIIEMPVVADVDGDGKAEIIKVSNSSSLPTLEVWGDANDSWVATRKVWNQTSYHVTNVNDDLTIPVHETPSWLQHNTYRLNALVEGCKFAKADLVASFVRTSSQGDSLRITARIGNSGSLGVRAGVSVAFYAGSPRQGGVLLGIKKLQTDLASGLFEDVTLDVVLSVDTADLWASADDAGYLVGAINELNESNNLARTPGANLTPSVNAGVDLTGDVGTALRLAGGAWDDGLPSPARLGVAWTQVEGPAVATFENAASLTSGVTFPLAGSYLLRLSVTDGALNAQDDLNVVIAAAPPPDGGPNRPPTAYAGPDQQTENGMIHLVGTATDDGKPIGHIGMSWFQVAGPADAVFSTEPGHFGADAVVSFPVLGRYTFRFTVNDNVLTVTDDVTVEVIAPPVNPNLPPSDQNAAPTVYSVATASVTEGYPLTVVGSYTDDGRPVGGPVTTQWRPISGPGSVVFDNPNAGTTSATFSTAGEYLIEYRVGDGSLFGAANVFVTVYPRQNEAPVIHVGEIVGVAGSPVLVTATYTDDGLPLGGPVSTQWRSLYGPATVSFDNPGALATFARFPEPGTYLVEFLVNDGDRTAGTLVTVFILPAPNRAPEVDAGPDQSISLPARTVSLTGVISDDGQPAGAALTSRWMQVSGPGAVTFADLLAPVTTAAFDAPGTYVLRLTGSDTDLKGSDDVMVTVVGQAPVGDAPVVSISSPTDLSNMTAPTDVVGTVTSASLLGWRLEIREGAEGADWRVIATGTTEQTNAILGKFDPTLLLNGIYHLRLVATDSSGRVGTTPDDQLAVNVRGNFKVGQFTLSFLDLSIPVSGIPIQLVRNYDSRDSRKGDFGFGWTLDASGMRVSENGKLGRGWRIAQYPGFFTTFCLEPTRSKRVTVTVSGGKTFEFEAVAQDACEIFSTPNLVGIGFRSLDGTNATLVPIDGEQVIVESGQLIDANGNIYDPNTYVLTLVNGQEFVVSDSTGPEGPGLKSTTDTNGNSITFGSGGITHSSGAGVAFNRDSEGRITTIVDPAGATYAYAYDVDGNLATATDPVGAVTRFTYDQNQVHYVRDVIDARGVRAARNDYDSDGRLVSTTDAAGKVVSFGHDIANRREVVVDRTGATTTLEFDARGNITKETDALGGVTLHSYDLHDNETSKTDPNGSTWAYEYDARDFQTKVTDPMGRVTTRTYHPYGKVLTETDPLGHTTSNGYDLPGNVISTSDALGNTYTNSYYPTGTLAFSGDPMGHGMFNTYDRYGFRIRSRDAFNNATTYINDSSGRVLTETRTRTTGTGTETLTTSYVYDAKGRVTQTHQPDGSVVRTTYNAIGLEATRVDALGRTTSMTYDDLGRLIQTSYPDGTNTGVTYDEEGRRATSRDAAGRVTTYGYDRLGRQLTTTAPDGAVTRSAYDLGRRQTSSTDALGNVTTYGYDAAGRRTTTTDALGNVVVSAFDAAGRNTGVTDARGFATTFAYDAANRRTGTAFADGTTTSTAYDQVGRRISETDQAGRTTAFGYDLLGRLVQVTDALGQATTYAYDELGNRVNQVDANLHETRFEYDKLGRQTKRVLPDGKFETKGYDLQGRMTSRTDFRLRTTTFGYDTSDRLELKTYPDASRVVFTYSATGRRLTAVDARGTTNYVYDNRDRVTKVTDPAGRSVEHAYDLSGRKITLGARVGGTVKTTTYSYDSVGRIGTVTDPDGRVFTETYDEASNPKTMLRPNGVDTAYSYDSLGRLLNIRTFTRSTNATVASYAYTVGATGLRTRIDEADGTSRVYAYDPLQRLTGEAVVGGGGPQFVKAFAYDAVSNRVAQATTGTGAGMVAYTYDVRDRLQTEGSASYTWDDNGNQVTKAGGDTYAWDFEDRLVRVTKLDGTVVDNTYDPDGVLVRTVITPTGGGPVKTTDFVVDTSGGLSHIVAEIDDAAPGAMSVVYVRAGSMLLEQIRGGVPKYPDAEGIGSVRTLLDAAGAVADTYRYTAFGEDVGRTGTDANPYQFAGERNVGAVGLYQNRARWLSTGTGAFVSMDRYRGTHWAPNTQIPYVYAAANPANLFDPSGNFYSVAEASIGIAAAATLSTVALHVGAATVAGAIVCTARLLLSAGGVDPLGGGGPCSVPDREIVVFRGLNGKNPGQFKSLLTDPDGLSTYEVLHPSPRYTLIMPFVIKFSGIKIRGRSGRVVSPLLGEGTYTPELGDPNIGLEHWSLKFPGIGDPLKELSDAAKSL